MRLSVFSVSVAAVASASLSVLVSATGVHPQDATGSFSLAHVGITIAAAVSEVNYNLRNLISEFNGQVVGYVVLTKFMSSSKSAEVEPARKGNFKGKQSTAKGNNRSTLVQKRPKISGRGGCWRCSHIHEGFHARDRGAWRKAEGRQDVGATVDILMLRRFL